MINYTEKGIGLHKLIEDSGYSLEQRDGEWISSDDNSVQIIIDTYNPLPYERLVAIEEVKEVASEIRLKFATLSAGKSAEYLQKSQELLQFLADGTVGCYMQARINRTGETAQVIADEWAARSTSLIGEVTDPGIGPLVAAIEDDIRIKVNSITNANDWQQIIVIKNNIIEELKAL